MVYARVRRAVPQRLFESRHRVGFAFRCSLHASIGQIANPPVQTVAARGRLDEIAKADTLNMAADEEPAGNAH